MKVVSPTELATIIAKKLREDVPTISDNLDNLDVNFKFNKIIKFDEPLFLKTELLGEIDDLAEVFKTPELHISDDYITYSQSVSELHNVRGSIEKTSSIHPDVFKEKLLAVLSSMVTQLQLEKNTRTNSEREIATFARIFRKFDNFPVINGIDKDSLLLTISAIISLMESTLSTYPPISVGGIIAPGDELINSLGTYLKPLLISTYIFSSSSEIADKLFSEGQLADVFGAFVTIFGNVQNIKERGSVQIDPNWQTSGYDALPKAFYELIHLLTCLKHNLAKKCNASNIKHARNVQILGKPALVEYFSAIDKEISANITGIFSLHSIKQPSISFKPAYSYVEITKDLLKNDVFSSDTYWDKRSIRTHIKLPRRGLKGIYLLSKAGRFRISINRAARGGATIKYTLLPEKAIPSYFGGVSGALYSSILIDYGKSYIRLFEKNPSGNYSLTKKYMPIL